MTDPWSVQGTNEVTRQINSVNELTDPYIQSESAELENDSQSLGFEDSFIQDNYSNPTIADSVENTSKEVGDTEHQPLPDSKLYVQNLERKLEKLKKSSKLVDALSEKRDDCLRSMLQNDSSSTCINDQLLELETSVTNSDSAVQNLYRQLQPIQPVTVGETVHIVKYDQLEEQHLEDSKEVEENLSASR